LGFNRITFETKGIGFFPDPRFPNVIFLELSERDDNSYKLAEQIENTVRKIGFERDKKFIPHVTLGRFKKGKKQKIESVQELSTDNFQIDIDSFCLMKSIMSDKGSTYEKIREFHFKSQDADI
jgi:RNA 2',3'-cyclic 3'-phosphodiesterase